MRKIIGIAALLLSSIWISSCAGNDPAQLRVGAELPGVPSYIAPVKRPKYVLGEDAVVAIAKADAAIDQANCRLIAASEWSKAQQEFYKTAGKTKIETEPKCRTGFEEPKAKKKKGK